MSEQSQPSSSFHNILPTEIEGVNSLAELALDLRWSWDHGADCVWKELDPALLELTSFLADSSFRKELRKRPSSNGSDESTRLAKPLSRLSASSKKLNYENRDSFS
jgi:hypothetical protein